MTVQIIAHAGHWAAGALYLAPVLVVVGALGWQSLKDRRAGPDDGDAGDDDVT
ncbi:MAG TPA: hypothetical protein VFT50_05720 [Baekduia sp.]|nr:hypothetical protein [Baekduia sp.]